MDETNSDTPEVRMTLETRLPGQPSRYRWDGREFQPLDGEG